jgi:fumarate reductase subunit C
MSGKYVRPWNKTTWFTQRRAYIAFMVRELTAVFVLVYLLALLIILKDLGGGPERFAATLRVLQSPSWRALHVLALWGAVWHAITWFNLTPKAMPVFIGEKKAPGPLVAIGMGYAPWIVVSILIVWLICP